MRVLVCGGRDFCDSALLLKVLHEQNVKHEFTMLIHGDARGADRMAGEWAMVNNIPVLRFPADWNKYKHGAGYIRNRRMLYEGKPNMVIAFPGGRGTANMIEQATKAGVPVFNVKRLIEKGLIR